MNGDPRAPGLPNRNPDLVRTVLPPVLLVWLFEALIALILGLSFAPLSISTGGLFVATFVAAAGVWGLVASYVTFSIYRSYRRRSPDWIRIEVAAVVGIYGRHRVGPREGEIATLPFDRVSDLSDGEDDRQGLHTPPQVRAKVPAEPAFDPKSVRALLRGPRPAVGVSTGFYLTKENFGRLRTAYGNWTGAGLFGSGPQS